MLHRQYTDEQGRVCHAVTFASVPEILADAATDTTTRPIVWAGFSTAEDVQRTLVHDIANNEALRRLAALPADNAHAKALAEKLDVPRVPDVRRRLGFYDTGERLDYDRLMDGRLDSCWQEARRKSVNTPPRIEILIDCLTTCRQCFGLGHDAEVENFSWRVVCGVALLSSLRAAGYTVALTGGLHAFTRSTPAGDNTIGLYDHNAVRDSEPWLIRFPIVGFGELATDQTLTQVAHPALIRCGVMPAVAANIGKVFCDPRASERRRARTDKPAFDLTSLVILDDKKYGVQWRQRTVTETQNGRTTRTVDNDEIELREASDRLWSYAGLQQTGSVRRLYIARTVTTEQAAHDAALDAIAELTEGSVA